MNIIVVSDDFNASTEFAQALSKQHGIDTVINSTLTTNFLGENRIAFHAQSPTRRINKVLALDRKWNNDGMVITISYKDWMMPMGEAWLRTKLQEADEVYYIISSGVAESNEYIGIMKGIRKGIAITNT